MVENWRQRKFDYQPAWFRVGDWLAEPSKNLITKSDLAISLEPKLMDLLLWFAVHAEQVQSNEVLLREVWGGTFYSDNPLHRSIAILRKMLGDDASTPKYLKTWRKRGYQLIAPIGFPDNVPRPMSPTEAKFTQQSPYPGLNAFVAQDAGVFFGRDEVVQKIAVAIQRQWHQGAALVFVLGPSGSGKSSLLQAGLLPRLLERTSNIEQALQSALVFDCKAHFEQSPFLLLIAQLCQWKIGDRSIFLPSDLACIGTDNEVSMTALNELLVARFDQAKAKATGPYPPFTCLIDHAEALTTIEKAHCSLIDSFLAALAKCGFVSVVLASRSDFYHDLSQTLPHCFALKGSQGHLDLQAPTAAEIGQMIRGPARIAGLSFERKLGSAERLDDVLRDAALRQPDALPMLQFTLEALYDNRSSNGLMTFAAYEKIGRLEGALVQRAESTVVSIENATACLSSLFQRLIQLEQSIRIPSARWVSWRELKTDSERELAQALVDQRLFVSSGATKDESGMNGNNAQFRPAHDALLRLWPRALQWCSENQQNLETHARVRLAATHWDGAGKRSDDLLNPGHPLQEAKILLSKAPLALSELDLEFIGQSKRSAERKSSIKKMAIAALVLLSVLTSIAGMYANWQRRIAEDRRAEAESMVDFLLQDVADQLRPLGRLDLLGAIGQRAFAHYEHNPTPAFDEDTLIRRSKAMRTAAESMIGQGQTKQALTLLQSASQYLRSLPEGQNNANLLLELGTNHYWQGYVYYQDKNLANAKFHWQEYRRQTDALLALDPKNETWQLESSYALNNLGTLAFYGKQWSPAIAYFSRSQELKQSLLQRRPQDVGLMADLADTVSWLGSALESNGKLDLAKHAFQSQTQLLKQAISQAPDDGEWRYRQALAWLHLARVELNLGNMVAANRLSVDAVRSLQLLYKLDNSNLIWRYDLAYAQVQLGFVQSQHGLSPAKAYQAAANHVNGVLNSQASNLKWRRLAAWLEFRRSDQKGDLPSLTRLQAVVSELSQLRKDAKSDASSQLAYAQAQLVLSQWLHSSNPNEAEDGFKAILRMYENNIPPSDLEVADLLARCYLSLNRIEDAEPLMQQLQAANYKHPDYLRWQEQFSRLTNKSRPAKLR